MEVNYAHKDTLTATDYVELNKNNELLISYNQALLKENQELKKHLKVPKDCNLKTLEDYKSYYEDTTRKQILEDTYIEYCAYVNLAHKYSKLKKWIDSEIENRDSEDLLKLYVELQEDNEKLLSRIRGFKSQRKEFINYLEKKINVSRNTEPFFVENIFSSYDLTEIELNMLQEILQKYKEIIGDDK